MAKKQAVKPVRGAKAKRVVAAALAGRTTRQIAQAEGIAPRTVTNVMRREAALIARLTDENESKLIAMYGVAIREMAKDLKSKSAGTRHDARQALLKYITAADRLRVAQDTAAGNVTLSEVLLVYGRSIRGTNDPEA